MRKSIPATIAITTALVLSIGQPIFAQDENIKFITNIEYIKGHLEQAVANQQAGDVALAKAHAAHPIAELYLLVEAELKERNPTLNSGLRSALTALPELADSTSQGEFQSRVAEINRMLDQAKESVVSEPERKDPRFNAQVIIALLETAELEYEEGVAEGQVVAMVEYQDASAFVSRAEAIFGSIKAQVPEHEAEEIAEFFEDLDGLVQSRSDIEQIEVMIGGIVHELEEALGLEVEDDEVIGGWEYVNTIQTLLDQSLEQYEGGNYQEAKRLAIVAYLENYEHIEGDIEEDDAKLMEKIEHNLREDLVSMIDERRPAAEIESLISTIKTDLELARTLVVPEFPLTTGLVLGAVAAAVLAGTLYTRRITYSNSIF